MASLKNSNSKINKMLILIVISIFYKICTTSLPNGCSFEAIQETSINTIVCNRLEDLTFDFLLINNTSKDYQRTIQIFNLYFHLNRPTIIDGSLRFEKLNLAFNSNKNLMTIIFNNVKGFEINQISSSNYYKNTNFFFVYSNLEFYSGNRLISSCEEYQMEHKYAERFSILQAAKNANIKFILSKYKSPICTLAFNSTIINLIILQNLISTFIKSNVLKFVEPKNNVSIKSTISNVVLDVEKIDLDQNLFNPSVFKSIRILNIIGSLKSIQNDLFANENFAHLESISIPICDLKV